MSSELVFFLLIIASVVVFVVHAVREDERVRARDQFWREHISKYNKRRGRERRLRDGKFLSQAERRRYEYIMKQHNKGDK
jgi:hypothetical protein